MNRRKFVVGAGALIGAGVLASGMRSESDSAPSGWAERGEDSLASAGAGAAAGKIDVHRHIVTPAMQTLLGRRNLDTLAGVALPGWSPEAFMASLQADAVHTAITSAVLPGIHCDVGELAQFSRSSNEYSRSLADRYPGRIGFFAHLPLPYTEQACAEAVYALDTLAADGVVLMASNAGKFLGDPEFDELMHELNSRSAVVFVHPNIPPSTDQLGLNTPLSVLEYPCDLTRAGLNLILSGTMERFHKIRWILAHAGGFLPYVAWRVSLANAMPEYGETATQGVLTYLRRFYLDTATSVSRSSMATLQELVEPSRLLFGSDSPFAPEQQTQRQMAELVQAGFWRAGLALQVQRSNALSLFPRYRQDGERVAVAPVFEQESVVGQAKRQILTPVRSLAQKLRE
ncbi:amidohydrolase family protein [Ectopseudomonas guguanensis]|uniref:Predicted metal-dependent hydrolase, TIM-barrel fold n=1 Tax=Ectopseudomonas guguanensis TaxID=1198456 RepID=A0A1H0X6I4_9GAMM|nr:amidohydrolase family protein [Pseudomonas guguanensis]SDP98530.1 Predicted metal-dependent hydrolase, TIM-barrel fold [Pseudomonas guguanensis]